MKGKFIVIDGCDFTGKSTQIQKIASYLRENNIKHITTREPGGTQFGESMRAIILEHGKKIHPCSELLLFMASRSEHINTKIIPMLEEGISIVCDRFLPSSFVYQSLLRGISSKMIESLHTILFNNIQPDITLVFDIEPEAIFQRMKAIEFQGCNSYDGKNIEEISIIRNGFAEYTQEKRYTKINADQRPEEVFADIKTKLDELFHIKNS